VGRIRQRTHVWVVDVDRQRQVRARTQRPTCLQAAQPAGSVTTTPAVTVTAPSLVVMLVLVLVLVLALVLVFVFVFVFVAPASVPVFVTPCAAMS